MELGNYLLLLASRLDSKSSEGRAWSEHRALRTQSALGRQPREAGEGAALGEGREGGRPHRPSRRVTLRMSCSCLSTACTSSCNSQRNSSSCGDRPVVSRPGPPPPAPPHPAREPHQHRPLRRRRRHHGRHHRRSLPSDRHRPAVRSPLSPPSRPGPPPAADWLRGRPPRLQLATL